MNKKRIRCLTGMALAVLLVVAGCSGGKAPSTTPSDQPITMQHVHGLGFSADGEQLLVPAHDGFRVYAKGRWETPDLPKHDYMGFAATDDGFYSSGHPAPGSKMKNPLGIVKSTDGGKTLKTLEFAGEFDFHAMGVGFRNHAIYVVNPQASAKLPAGVHYSLDDGKTWRKTAFGGLASKVIQIAVHPTKPDTVAAATQEGLFLSTTSGESFERLSEAQPVSSVAFSPEGETLYYGTEKLFAYGLSSKQVRPLNSPVIPAKDAIGFVAVNPARTDQIVFATFGATVYISEDSGRRWSLVADQGAAK